MELIDQWQSSLKSGDASAGRAAALLGGCLRDLQAPQLQRLACVQGLGNAESLSPDSPLRRAAAAELNQSIILELSLRRDERNAYVARAVAQNLGRLADRRSFAPLLRLMRSSYPTMVRRAAQRAINEIDWQPPQVSPANP